MRLAVDVAGVVHRACAAAAGRPCRHCGDQARRLSRATLLDGEHQGALLDAEHRRWRAAAHPVLTAASAAPAALDGSAPMSAAFPYRSVDGQYGVATSLAGPAGVLFLSAWFAVDPRWGFSKLLLDARSLAASAPHPGSWFAVHRATTWGRPGK